MMLIVGLMVDAKLFQLVVNACGHQQPGWRGVNPVIHGLMVDDVSHSYPMVKNNHSWLRVLN